MKRIAFFLLLLLAVGHAMARQDVPVILVAGQSNADGRVPVSDLPDSIGEYKYCQWSYGSGDYETATGLFTPFSPRVAKPGIEASWGFDAVVYHQLEQLWQRPFYVIKQTMGGTAIDLACASSTKGWYWSADAGEKSLLKAFCQQIDDCLPNLPEDYDIKCLVWHQGESDQPAADRYYDNMKAVVAYIRQHLVDKTGRTRYAQLPVVCGTFSKDSRQGSPVVADALRRLASEDRNFRVVEATDLPLLRDRLHFNAEGAQVLGLRVFAEIVGLTAPAQQVKALPDDAWNNAEWICVADAPEVTGRVNEHTRAADGANWFVASVVNEQKIVKALWMTASLGVNELFVNGKRVGNEVLRPGFSHHSRTKYSFTYDVTRQFQTKKGDVNTLAAQVTPGWWADKIITPSGSNGMYGQKCAFRGVLELTFADGSKRRYGTNTNNWKAGIAGPVRHAAIFDGEEYDARVPSPVDEPSVCSALSVPAVSKEYVGIIVPSCGAEVYQLHELALNQQHAYVYSKTEGANDEAYGKIVIDREYHQPTPMTVRPGEHLVIDFGQNCAAVPSFRFKAREGTRLTCLPGELLNDGNGAKSRGMDGPEGSVHRRNLRIHDGSIRLDYTFADSKKAVDYMPRSTFFGYRYLDITSTDEVVIEQIHSIPVSSITPEMETGHIITGNDLINQLISNTVWGMRSNYLSVPTDCPQRNERLGWTADTQVFCETGTYFANTNRFFHKWLHDLRDSQSKEGGFPGVAPAGQYGSGNREYMRVGWADAGIIVPWTVWKQYGDNTIIEESWQSMQQYMDHITATKYDHTALSQENGNYQWGDWLSYEPLESCGGGAFKDGSPLPEAVEYWNYLGASYWALNASMMVDMAKATGRHIEQQQYAETLLRATNYLRERFFNADGTFKCEILNTMQTPALFALRNHLFEGEAKAKMTERLRQNFSEHGDCLQTGFLGTSILMPTLTDNDMTDVAYDLLFQRKNPSWLYSVDNGATTIWERWNSYMKEKGMGPKGMNSFNHYAYGCVCQWIWQTCAGIASDPAQPGFKHIVMRPQPDRRLGYLEASYQSAAGLIKSSWHYQDDLWVWDVSIPQGSTATVCLPDGRKEEIGAGNYTFNTKE
jgi:alpha-L-rhamnosidase